MRGILTRAERRQMERAKEAHIKNLAKAGYSVFKDITDEPRTCEIAAELSNKPEKVFVNGLFIVQVYDYPCAWSGTKRVMIRRNDAAPVHDWGVFQKIKNDLFGPERVALEVYPAESNKQDVANMYWLFVLPEGFDCPVEWKRRKPQGQVGGHT